MSTDAACILVRGRYFISLLPFIYGRPSLIRQSRTRPIGVSCQPKEINNGFLFALGIDCTQAVFQNCGYIPVSKMLLKRFKILTLAIPVVFFNIGYDILSAPEVLSLILDNACSNSVVFILVQQMAKMEQALKVLIKICSFQ